ncbi:hypothetical protein F5Y08DRAFT_313992 [Xylaria arbuscula]|nr:hypothetical protein F5Y08DRAFT_313992 [Xylaria arbuscula]
MEECLGELFMLFIMDIIWKGMMLPVVYAIDKFIVQRRNGFVSKARRLQSILKIPSCPGYHR